MPQFYTEDKVYRVEGVNGQQFVRVNQQVIARDPLGNAVHKVLNDLSVGTFDIVVSDVEASTTQRQAQMWSLVDAVSRLGVPGDLVFDLIIDLSDIPHKEDIKQRYAQRLAEQQQAQAQNNLQTQQLQATLQLAQIQATRQSQSISFKDAPLPLQFAMAAQQGLIDPQVGQYAVDLMVEQLFPQLAAQMAKQRQAAQGEAQQAQLLQLLQLLQQKAKPQQPQQPQGGGALTKAAVQSLTAGSAPAL